MNTRHPDDTSVAPKPAAGTSGWGRLPSAGYAA
jgi:hypothetical protein